MLWRCAARRDAARRTQTQIIVRVCIYGVLHGAVCPALKSTLRTWCSMHVCEHTWHCSYVQHVCATWQCIRMALHACSACAHVHSTACMCMCALQCVDAYVHVHALACLYKRACECACERAWHCVRARYCLCANIYTV